MRFPSLLAALWLAGTTAAVAAPPGYHPPRRRYTPRGIAYVRPTLRLHLSGNLAYYNGDITGRLIDNTLRLGYGLGFTQALSPHLTFTADVARVLLKAQDQTPARGLRFEGSNGVLSALLRYNLFADKSMYTSLSRVPSPVQVFVQAGVAGLLYHPSASLQNVALDPEPGNSYPQVAAAFPVGAGVTLHASPRLCLTLDARYYFTTTDLLDDVSRRANPNTTDSFGTVALQVEYVIGKKRPRPLVHYN